MNVKNNVFKNTIVNKMNTSNQPLINKEFQDYYSQQICDTCGHNNTKAIFKNDLLNDPRLYNTKLQTKEDFHALCKRCAKEKKRIGTYENINKCFYPNKKIMLLKCFFDDNNEYKVVDDNENVAFDITDINAKVNTFWYDPVQFMRGVHSRYKQIENQFIERRGQIIKELMQKEVN